MNFGTISVK